jgi:hypothetical protein
MKYAIFLTVIIAALFASHEVVTAQGNAGDGAPVELRFVVDMPTAGILAKGGFGVYVNTFPGGGMMADVSYGLTSWLNVGASFGVNNLIGNGEISVQDYPAVHVRARLFNETLVIPAITIGFNSQGRGGFLGERFQTQPAGIFAAASKSYRWPLGLVSLHLGVCYSLSPNHPARQIPNVYLGAEHSVGPFLSVAAEYNPTLDERFPSVIYLESGGILNLALRCSVLTGMTVEVQFRDVLRNFTDVKGVSRTLGIEIVRTL